MALPQDTDELPPVLQGLYPPKPAPFEPVEDEVAALREQAGLPPAPEPLLPPYQSPDVIAAENEGIPPEMPYLPPQPPLGPTGVGRRAEEMPGEMMMPEPMLPPLFPSENWEPQYRIPTDQKEMVAELGEMMDTDLDLFNTVWDTMRKVIPEGDLIKQGTQNQGQSEESLTTILEKYPDVYGHLSALHINEMENRLAQAKTLLPVATDEERTIDLMLNVMQGKTGMEETRSVARSVAAALPFASGVELQPQFDDWQQTDEAKNLWTQWNALRANSIAAGLSPEVADGFVRGIARVGAGEILQKQNWSLLLDAAGIVRDETGSVVNPARLVQALTADKITELERTSRSDYITRMINNRTLLPSDTPAGFVAAIPYMDVRAMAPVVQTFWHEELVAQQPWLAKYPYAALSDRRVWRAINPTYAETGVPEVTHRGAVLSIKQELMDVGMPDIPEDQMVKELTDFWQAVDMGLISPMPFGDQFDLANASELQLLALPMKGIMYAADNWPYLIMPASAALLAPIQMAREWNPNAWEAGMDVYNGGVNALRTMGGAVMGAIQLPVREAAEYSLKTMDSLGYDQPLVDAYYRGEISHDLLSSGFSFHFDTDAQREVVARVKMGYMSEEEAIMKYSDPFKEMVGGTLFDPTIWATLLIGGIGTTFAARRAAMSTVGEVMVLAEEAGALDKVGIMGVAAKAAARVENGAVRSVLSAIAEGRSPAYWRSALTEALKPSSLMRGLIGVGQSTGPFGGPATSGDIFSDLVGNVRGWFGLRSTNNFVEPTQEVSRIKKAVQAVSRGHLGSQAGKYLTNYGNINNATLIERRVGETMRSVLNVWETPADVRSGLAALGKAYTDSGGGEEIFLRFVAEHGLGWSSESDNYKNLKLLGWLASQPRFQEEIGLWNSLLYKADEITEAAAKIAPVNAKGSLVSKKLIHPEAWAGLVDADARYATRRVLDSIPEMGVKIADPANWASPYKRSLLNATQQFMRSSLNVLMLTSPAYFIRNAANNFAMLFNMGKLVSPFGGVDTLEEFGIKGRFTYGYVGMTNEEISFFWPGMSRFKENRRGLEKVTGLIRDYRTTFGAGVEGRMRESAVRSFFTHFYSPQHMRIVTERGANMYRRLREAGIELPQGVIAGYISHLMETPNPKSYLKEAIIIPEFGPVNATQFAPKIQGVSVLPTEIRRVLTERVLRVYMGDPVAAKVALADLKNAGYNYVVEAAELNDPELVAMIKAIGEEDFRKIFDDSLAFIRKSVESGQKWEDVGPPAVGMAVHRMEMSHYFADEMRSADEIVKLIAEVEGDPLREAVNPDTLRIWARAHFGEEPGQLRVQGIRDYAESTPQELVQGLKDFIKTENKSAANGVRNILKSKGTDFSFSSDTGKWARINAVLNARDTRVRDKIKEVGGAYNRWLNGARKQAEEGVTSGMLPKGINDRFKALKWELPKDPPVGEANWLARARNLPGEGEHVFGALATTMHWASAAEETAYRTFRWIDALTDEEKAAVRFAYSLKGTKGQKAREIIMDEAKVISQKLQDARASSEIKAFRAADWALHDYAAQGDLDFLLNWIFPWQFWWTRTIPKMAVNFAHRPYLLSTILRFHETMGSEFKDWNQLRLENYFKIPMVGLGLGGVSGDVFVDPISVFIPMEALRTSQFEDEMDGTLGNVYQLVDRFAAPNPLLNFAMAVTGLRGARAKEAAVSEQLGFWFVRAADSAIGLTAGKHILTWPYNKWQAFNILQNMYGNGMMSDADYEEATKELKRLPNNLLQFGEPNFNNPYLKQAWKEARTLGDVRGLAALTGIAKFQIRLDGEDKIEAEADRQRETVTWARQQRQAEKITAEQYAYLIKEMEDSSKYPKALLNVWEPDDVGKVIQAEDDFWEGVDRINAATAASLKGVSLADTEKIYQAEADAIAEKKALLKTVAETWDVNPDQISWLAFDEKPATPRDTLLQRLAGKAMAGTLTLGDIESLSLVLSPAIKYLSWLGIKSATGTITEDDKRKFTLDMADPIAALYWALSFKDGVLYQTQDGIVRSPELYRDQRELLEMLPEELRQAVITKIRNPKEVLPVRAALETWGRRFVAPFNDGLTKALEGITDPVEREKIRADYEKNNPPPTKEQLIDWVMEDYTVHDPSLPFAGDPNSPYFWMPPISYNRADLEEAIRAMPDWNFGGSSYTRDIARLKAWTPESGEKEPTFYAPSGIVIDHTNVGEFEGATQDLALYQDLSDRVDAGTEPAYKIKGKWTGIIDRYFGNDMEREKTGEYITKLRSYVDQMETDLKANPDLATNLTPEGIPLIDMLNRTKAELAYWEDRYGKASAALEATGGSTLEAGQSTWGTDTIWGPVPGSATIADTDPTDFSTILGFYVAGGNDTINNLRDLWTGINSLPESTFRRLTSLYQMYPMGAPDVNTWINVTLPSVFANNQVAVLAVLDPSVFTQLADYWAGKAMPSPSAEATLYELFQLTHPQGGEFASWVQDDLQKDIAAHGADLFDWLGGTMYKDDLYKLWQGGVIDSDTETQIRRIYERMPMGSTTFDEWLYEKLPVSMGAQVFKSKPIEDIDPLVGFMSYGGESLVDDILAYSISGEPLNPAAERDLWQLYLGFPMGATNFKEWLGQTLPHVLGSNAARVLAISNTSVLNNLVDYWRGIADLTASSRQTLVDLWRSYSPGVTFADWVTKDLLESYVSNQGQMFMDLGGSAIVDELTSYWEQATPLPDEVRTKLNSMWQSLPMGATTVDEWIDEVLPAEMGKYFGMKINLLSGWGRFTKMGGGNYIRYLIARWATGEMIPTKQYNALRKIYNQMPLGAESYTEWLDVQLRELYQSQPGRQSISDELTWKSFARAATAVLGPTASKSFIHSLLATFYNETSISRGLSRQLRAVRQSGLLPGMGSLENFIAALEADWRDTYADEIRGMRGRRQA